MRGALVHCLDVELTIPVLVPVGLLLHDVALHVGGEAAEAFQLQQCFGAEARCDGLAEWLSCYSEE